MESALPFFPWTAAFQIIMPRISANVWELTWTSEHHKEPLPAIWLCVSPVFYCNIMHSESDCENPYAIVEWSSAKNQFTTEGLHYNALKCKQEKLNTATNMFKYLQTLDLPFFA